MKSIFFKLFITIIITILLFALIFSILLITGFNNSLTKWENDLLEKITLGTKEILKSEDLNNRNFKNVSSEDKRDSLTFRAHQSN